MFMTVFYKVHIYFKDFDRNFQNNYYFVLFPSIQFLNNLPSTTVDACYRFATAYIYYHTYNLKSSIFQGFFKVFLTFFQLFFESFFAH